MHGLITLIVNQPLHHLTSYPPCSKNLILNKKLGAIVPFYYSRYKLWTFIESSIKNLGPGIGLRSTTGWHIVTPINTQQVCCKPFFSLLWCFLMILNCFILKGNPLPLGRILNQSNILHGVIQLWRRFYLMPYNVPL